MQGLKCLAKLSHGSAYGRMQFSRSPNLERANEVLVPDDGTWLCHSGALVRVGWVGEFARRPCATTFHTIGARSDADPGRRTDEIVYGPDGRRKVLATIIRERSQHLQFLKTPWTPLRTSSDPELCLSRHCRIMATRTLGKVYQTTPGSGFRQRYMYSRVRCTCLSAVV